MTDCSARPARTAAVDIWLRHIDAAAADPSAVDGPDPMLSDDERRRAGRYLSLHARRTFIEGRRLMRAVLGRYTLTAPQDVVLDITPRGKPFLADTSSSIRFNLSHDTHWLVLAVSSSGEVGIDVEALDRRVDVPAVSEMAMSPCERARLRQSADALPAFFAHWTAKEAVAKAEGAGLALDLRTIDFMPPPDVASRALVQATIAEHGSWWVRLLPIGTTHVMAVAHAEPGFVVRSHVVESGPLPAATAIAAFA